MKFKVLEIKMRFYTRIKTKTKTQTPKFKKKYTRIA